MFNRAASTTFIAPRRQEIQKSPFHPPLTKGERGGFEETWHAFASLRFGSGHALRENSFFVLFAAFVVIVVFLFKFAALSR
jgi:hypothetical protein